MKKAELRQLIREIIEAEIDADGNLVGFAAPKSDKLSDFQAAATRGVEDMASILSTVVDDLNHENVYSDMNGRKNSLLKLMFTGGRGKNQIRDTMTKFLSQQSKLPNLTPEIYGKLELLKQVMGNASWLEAHKENADKILSAINLHPQKFTDIKPFVMEASVDADGNLVDFSGGDWKSQVGEYDHIHFFIEPQMADQLEDKLIMAGIDMVDNYPYKGKYLLRVSLGSNAAADLAKAEKIVGQEAKKGSPENETDSSDMWGSDGWGLTNTDDRMNEGMGDRIAKWFADGTIKIMDWAFYSIIADNEDAFKLLMETLENATNEEKLEMLTNLSNFRPKPTLRKLAQIELAKIADRQDQLKKAFR